MWPRDDIMSEAEVRKANTARRREESPVRRQETCPCCGKKMTNIYRRDEEWKCKACWDKINLKETVA